MKPPSLQNLEEAAKSKEGLRERACHPTDVCFKVQPLGPPLGVVSVQNNQVTDFPGTRGRGHRARQAGREAGALHAGGGAAGLGGPGLPSGFGPGRWASAGRVRVALLCPRGAQTTVPKGLVTWGLWVSPQPPPLPPSTPVLEMRPRLLPVFFGEGVEVNRELTPEIR